MKICICALIMDEHDYIEEWIDFYIENFKINKFFLYEDYFSKSHKDIISKYGDIVQLIPLKNVQNIEKYDKYKENATYRQIVALLDFYNNHKQDFDCCLFFDPDEFLENNPDIFFEEINKYKDDSDVKCIAYRWQTMKSNGLIKKPKGKYSVVNTYTNKYLGNYDDLNTNIKCCFFLNHLSPEFIDNKYIHNIPHGAYTYNLEKIAKNVPLSKIRLRHYLCKSFEEYCNRLYIKGEQNKQWARNINLFFDINCELAYKQYELLKPYIDKKVKVNCI